MLYDSSFFSPICEACIFVENLVAIYPFLCFNVNLSYQDELINGLLQNMVFPEVSETRQHVSVAYWLLLTNTRLQLKPQISSIDVECAFGNSAVTLNRSKIMKYFVHCRKVPLGQNIFNN